MKASPPLDNRDYITLLLHWRWLILAIAIPLSVVIEMLEGDTHDLHFLDEVIIDGMVLPLATWLVLTFAARKMRLQFAQEEQLRQRQRFMHELAEHRDYPALTEWIVRFFGREFGVGSVKLALYDEERKQLTPPAEWLAPSEPGFESSRGTPPREYRFVIVQNNRQVGVLSIRARPGSPLTREQQTLLTTLMPEIARALSQALADAEATQRMYREAQLRERRRIARELHDSLAQQVFYLHLNLDQFAEDAALVPHETTRAKMAAMRDVAADVYDQIRHNLSILRAWEQVDLTEAIAELALVTAYNANLAVDVQVHGEPDWLSPHTSERIYGIAREALHNVVKHAQAQRLHVTLEWLDDTLQLTLTDDGIGFDPEGAVPEGHYGLSLMRETVEALNGQWQIDSAPGAGTSVAITVPFTRAGALPLRPQPIGVDMHVSTANL